MLQKLLLLLLFGALPAVWAQESVTLPLGEYQSLYREHIEQAISDKLPTDTRPPLISIDKASYQLNIDQHIAKGRVELSGVLIRGQPEPLPLFTSELAVTELESVQGGQVISDEKGYRFVSDGSERFAIKLSVSLALNEDARSRYLAFEIPRAVQNSLKIAISSDERIVEAPGVALAAGHYYFSPRSHLQLRIHKHETSGQQQAPVIDTFTRIEQQDNQLLLTSYFIPLRDVDSPFKLKLSAGAHYLESSLPPSQLKVSEDGPIQIDLAQAKKPAFYIRYELSMDGNSQQYRLTLPEIERNKGRQGEFIVEQPIDRELTVNADGLKANLPSERLPPNIRNWAEIHSPYARVASGTALQLDIKKYRPVPTPDVVLDAVRFFSIFDESGNVMSTLRLQVPAHSGERLHIKPIPGAELWSVNVNGKSQSMYSLDDALWIIPIQAQQQSLVELKFLQRGGRLGLSGHVNTMLPETGLTARNVYVAIGLPQRVELVSLDGDVIPASAESWVHKQTFSGRRYFFKRAFYKGQALGLTVYYKEPVNPLEGELR